MAGNPNDIGAVSSNSGNGYMIGRVKSIILGEYNNLELGIKNNSFENYGDIGKIEFELLYTPTNISTGPTSKDAYPIFSAVKQLPVIGEIVLIVPGPSPDLNDDFANKRLFYFLPFATWNAVNHNVHPNLQELGEFNNQQSKKPDYQGNAKKVPLEIPKGYNFGEQDHIRALMPFEGDTIIESRFGQSIRFGSTSKGMKKLNYWSEAGKDLDPIIIIRNGQGTPTYPKNKFATTVEDINSDATSIYLTAGQKIVINSLIGFPLDSFGDIKLDPLTQNIIKSFQPEVSNNFLGAAFQDNKTLNSIK